jgi:CBS domain containing-hemolysin-like protein
MILAALGVAAALILINAVYVAAEFAIVGVRRSRVRQLAGEGSRLARWLLPAIESPVDLDRYIAACQIGITLSGLLLGAFAQSGIAPLLAPLLGSATGLSPAATAATTTAAVLVLLTGAQTIFAELVPKALALQFPTQAAFYTFIPLAPSRWVYRPFIIVLNGTARVLLRAIGARHLPSRHVHSPQEIALLVADSRDGGLLEADEYRRLQRALRLAQKTARHLMVPRPQIERVDIDTPPAALLTLVATSPYSRLPVYKGTVDNVVGIVRTKDVVAWLVNEDSATTIGPLVRAIATVPEGMTVDGLLRVFREQRTHVALVVDEHGGTEGLVTLDDVLMELLGEVGDEFKAADPTAEELGDGQWRLPGALSATDASALLGTTWEIDATTVGGLVTAVLGHLPAAGDQLDFAGFDWLVEQMSGRAIESVVATRRAVPSTEEPA